jgi:hypothetical protein
MAFGSAALGAASAPGAPVGLELGWLAGGGDATASALVLGGAPLLTLAACATK